MFKHSSIPITFMALAQLTYRESLRGIVTCLNAVPEKMYPMEIRSEISVSVYLLVAILKKELGLSQSLH